MDALAAVPGGLSDAALIAGLRALDRRRAVLLPVGGAPEAIAEHAHRWSVAVLMAGILDHSPGQGRSTWLLAKEAAAPDTLVWLGQAPGLLLELEAWLSSGELVGSGAIGALAGGSGMRRCPESADDAGGAETVDARPDDTVRCFFAWLDGALAAQALRVNASGAVLHGVQGGMLLASPGLFRACVRDPANGGITEIVPAGLTVGDQVRRLLRSLVRARCHQPGADGSDLVTLQRRGSQGTVAITGLLVPAPGRFIARVPPPDPAMMAGETSSEGDSA
jgi:hypothetical protein